MQSWNQRKTVFRPARARQLGFTMVELLIAMAVLMFGIAAVAQLIPISIQSNMRNRYDSTAVVVAERLLNQMISQPLTATQFTDIDGNVRLLGGAAGLVGNPVQVVSAIPNGALNLVRVDFGVNAVAGYNFMYTNPNDSIGIPYEVRWTVITNLSGATVVSKRILVGVWKRDPRNVTVPVTVEAWVQR
ncbi:MAG: prepilin-type N-terminal cleavage/methylation domain-containing protein [Acidobacteria bacterium]|nr:prepilin-type N-terminal cleavage/methylation domain-containing protein [Acidobacteriota bacterium]MCL5288684.1 prepilin-type N-terminal cleavage/methylation domain-containing protein [Acidobacteriota bacterium]